MFEAFMGHSLGVLKGVRSTYHELERLSFSPCEGAPGPKSFTTLFISVSRKSRWYPHANQKEPTEGEGRRNCETRVNEKKREMAFALPRVFYVR